MLQVKNNFYKIGMCTMIANVTTIFASQAPQDFTPKTLMETQPCLKGTTICFLGNSYKVVKDELHACDKKYANLLSRWITLQKSKTFFLQTDEINLASHGCTQGGISNEVNGNNSQVISSWYPFGSDQTCVCRKTYISTFAKVLGISTVLAGITAWQYKFKSSK